MYCRTYYLGYCTGEVLYPDVWCHGAIRTTRCTGSDRQHKPQVLHKRNDCRVHGTKGQLPGTHWQVCVCACLCVLTYIIFTHASNCFDTNQKKNINMPNLSVNIGMCVYMHVCVCAYTHVHVLMLQIALTPIRRN